MILPSLNPPPPPKKKKPVMALFAEKIGAD